MLGRLRKMRPIKHIPEGGPWEMTHVGDPEREIAADDSKNIVVIANSKADAHLMAARHHGCASHEFESAEIKD